MVTVTVKEIEISPFTDEIQEKAKYYPTCLKFGDYYINVDVYRYQGKLYIWEHWPSRTVIKEVSY